MKENFETLLVEDVTIAEEDIPAYKALYDLMGYENLRYYSPDKVTKEDIEHIKQMFEKDLLFLGTWDELVRCFDDFFKKSYIIYILDTEDVINILDKRRWVECEKINLEDGETRYALRKWYSWDKVPSRLQEYLLNMQKN